MRAKGGFCSCQDGGRKDCSPKSSRDKQTSDGKTLLPGLVGRFGVSLEPELSLGVDLIAVWLNRSEGLHGNVLQECTEQGESA